MSNINNMDTQDIKSNNLSLSYEERRGEKGAFKCNSSSRNSQKIQRLLRRKLNKQIGQSGKAYREILGGKDMSNERKNEAKKDIFLYNFIKDNKKYKNSWDIKKTDNKVIQSILDKASKRKTGNRGEPDLLYINEANKLIILLENKDTIKQHQSKEGNDPENYAIDGIKHYLSFFTDTYVSSLPETTRKNWKIVGIAVSGNILDLYSHLISTFIINKNEIKDIETKEILNEEEYLSFFENVDMERLIREVSESSKKINNKLRSLDSQKRPVLLSGLMICLFTRGDKNDFKDGYIGWNPKTIINNIPTTITQILKDEKIPKDKIEVLTNELSFIKTDQDLNNTDILKEILEELDKNVIPLFSKETNYDILGKFYEEFLRYAGISNVKNGIVLTPSHITKLFTELVEIKNNDVILDTCCGTGAFLISAMNKIILEINQSNIRNKAELIKNIKQHQLIGFEKSSTMYALSISNMLFRGDGKSMIFNVDSFSKEANEILGNLKKDGISPTIGFINPPYGGEDNKDNPTKKEIQFLENLLDKVSRFGVIIAPLSTYMQDEDTRERILSKHTLKCVINMPKDLFRPNATTHTAIAVFETNKPHNNKEIVFYNLEDDGLVLSKNRGRTDALDKWANIRKKLLEELNNPDKFSDGFHLVKTKINQRDEWIIQAHSKTDYTYLESNLFTKSIKDYIIFKIKLKLDILDKNIDELTFMEILNENKIYSEKNENKKINTDNWKEFNVNDIFDVTLGTPVHKVNVEFSMGGVNYITRSAFNNGYAGKILHDEEIPEIGDCITIGAEGVRAFYQEEPFFTGNKINIIRTKDNKITKDVAMFLITIFNFEMKDKFSYGRAIVNSQLKKMKIKLPKDKKGNPDWEFMENYIKSLPYSSNL